MFRNKLLLIGLSALIVMLGLFLVYKNRSQIFKTTPKESETKQLIEAEGKEVMPRENYRVGDQEIGEDWETYIVPDEQQKASFKYPPNFTAQSRPFPDLVICDGKLESSPLNFILNCVRGNSGFYWINVSFRDKSLDLKSIDEQIKRAFFSPPVRRVKINDKEFYFTYGGDVGVNYFIAIVDAGDRLLSFVFGGDFLKDYVFEEELKGVAPILSTLEIK